MSDLLTIAIGAIAGALAYTVARVLRHRLRRPKRVVEAPNSHYTPQLVRDRESHDRWKSISLERVHEINREEVTRLLAKVEALGIESLHARERSFLDHLADLHGRKPSSPGSLTPPHLGEATT